MNYDLLIKCFIAFCVGAIIYKFISDRCSCGIVEGQNDNTQPPPPPPPQPPNNTDANQPGFNVNEFMRVFADPKSSKLDIASAITGTKIGNNNSDMSSLSSNVPIDDIQTFINTVNQNIFMSSIKETISNVIGALQSDKFSEDNIPNSINATTTFEDFHK